MRRGAALSQLAVVEGNDLLDHELERDALGRLGRRDVPAAAVARGQLGPYAGDNLGLAVDRRRALEHHPAQLVVRVAGLDLQRAARVALEVAHLLRLRVRPRPALAVAQHVPERHQVGPAVAAGRGDGEHSPGIEERGHLRVAHGDRGAPVHAEVAKSRSAAASTASRASCGSSTTASPASLSTSRTRKSVPLNVISTTIPPSSRSAITVRCSRAQRACSGEIRTRATREPPTVPVRGQPPTSATAFRPSRGWKRSSSAVARLMRSSRKCLSCVSSHPATYHQPSRPLINAYGSTTRVE